MQAWSPQDMVSEGCKIAFPSRNRPFPSIFSFSSKNLGGASAWATLNKIETIGFCFSIFWGRKVRLHQDGWPRQQRRRFRHRAASAGPAAAGISHQRPALPARGDPGGGEELRILRVGTMEGWNTGRSSGGRLGDAGWSEVGSVFLLCESCRFNMFDPFGKGTAGP